MAKLLQRFMNHHAPLIRPFWAPAVAGFALGAVLLLTFVLTGHGLGATGFTTRLVAWMGSVAAPQATMDNAYLGGMVEDGHPLASWITWQVVGVFVGAGLSAWWSGRLRLQVDGEHTKGRTRRMALALGGGLLAGAGARISAGCVGPADGLGGLKFFLVCCAASCLAWCWKTRALVALANSRRNFD